MTGLRVFSAEKDEDEDLRGEGDDSYKKIYKGISTDMI